MKAQPLQIDLTQTCQEIESIRCAHISKKNPIAYISGDLTRKAERKVCPVVVLNITTSRILSNF